MDIFVLLLQNLSRFRGWNISESTSRAVDGISWVMNINERIIVRPVRWVDHGRGVEGKDARRFIHMQKVTSVALENGFKLLPSLKF